MLALILSAALSAEPSAIPSLNSKNFDSVITSEQLWLVKFYAPWCGHCKRLAPILDDIVSRPEAVGDAKIAKVDCTVEKALCDRFEVRGFPALKLIHEGNVWEHKGSRSKAAIETLLSRMQKPPVSELPSLDALKAAMAATSVNQAATYVLVDEAGAGGGGASATALRESYRQTARKMQHKDTFTTTSSGAVVAALLAEGGASSTKPSTPGPFVVRAEAGEAPAIFAPEQEATKPLTEALSEFVETHRLLRFSVAGPSNFYELATSGRPLLLAIVDPKTLGVDALAKEHSEAPGPLADLRALSRDPALQKEFVFAMLDFVENEEHITSAYFIPRDTLPRLVALHRGKGGERAFAVDTPGDASGGAERVRAFAEAVAAGRVAYEYEGMWGLPDRWYRKAKGYVPALSALDALPKYSIAASLAVLLAAGIVRLLMVGEYPEDDGFVDRKARAPVRRTKKAD